MQRLDANEPIDLENLPNGLDESAHEAGIWDNRIPEDDDYSGEDIRQDDSLDRDPDNLLGIDLEGEGELDDDDLDAVDLDEDDDDQPIEDEGHTDEENEQQIQGSDLEEELPGTDCLSVRCTQCRYDVYHCRVHSCDPHSLSIVHNID